MWLWCVGDGCILGDRGSTYFCHSFTPNLHLPLTRGDENRGNRHVLCKGIFNVNIFNRLLHRTIPYN